MAQKWFFAMVQRVGGSEGPVIVAAHNALFGAVHYCITKWVFNVHVGKLRCPCGYGEIEGICIRAITYRAKLSAIFNKRIILIFPNTPIEILYKVLYNENTK